jgi:hypothetical protein
VKLIIRSSIALLFLLALAMPSLAQNPNVAIRVTEPSAQGCFRITVKNMRTSQLKVTAAYLTVFDQSTCRIACEFKTSVRRNVNACDNLSFDLCCPKSLPRRYIAYVRVAHARGNNEAWFFHP